MDIWYKHPVTSDVAHVSLISLCDRLSELDLQRRQKNLARARVYEGETIRRMFGSLIDDASIARLNVLKSICDTFASRLAKERPMPSIVVDDGDWLMKRKAEKNRAFVVGQMRETEFDDLSIEALQDGTITGSAFTRIDDADGSVIAERIPVNDMVFDERELKYGKPRNAYRVTRIAREELVELFPEKRAAIMSAPQAEPSREENQQIDLSDYVDTWEAWHLPTTRDSDCGRHALCVNGATLVYEQWHEPRFPFAMFRLFKPLSGLWGKGFVDQLISLQHRVNLIIRDIQLNLSVTGRGHYLVNEASDIPVEMLSASDPFKIKYRGNTPPQWIAPTPFNASQMAAADKFIQYMYDLTGVSRASAESRSALGPGASGVALDTQYDIDSDRFRLPQSNYARYRLDAAQRYIDAARRVARRRATEKGRKRSWVGVAWKGRDAIARLEYSKVELDDDSYRLQLEAVNFIPDTRAGKLSTVEQLAKAGVIPQWLVATLFNDPDLQAANGIMLAAYHNAIRKMDLLADSEQIPPVPEPYNDVELEHKIAVATYNKHQADNAPEDVLDRFRVYIDLLTDALKERIPAQPPPEMAPAQQPEPGGVPMMPPGPVPAPEMIGAPPMVS